MPKLLHHCPVTKEDIPRPNVQVVHPYCLSLLLGSRMVTVLVGAFRFFVTQLNRLQAQLLQSVQTRMVPRCRCDDE
jgi:hypothetical protein